MKKISTFVFALVTFFSLQAQNHMVDVGSNFFAPQHLTIAVGETVQWTNTGGFHNVNAPTSTYPDNPESFINGPASTNPWTFEYTFTLPGTYMYHCDPHVSIGMTGSITVEGGDSNTSDIVITEIMYNPPNIANTPDLEFIELYNNTSAAIDLTNWSFTSGFEFVFPSTSLGAGEYLVLSNDASLMTNIYGVTSIEWTDGGLNNSGENIILVDAAMNPVDSVDYDDNSDGWPSIADGNGPSLVLCDVNSDNNDPTNWQRAITPINYIEDCQEVFANPGIGATCGTLPIITFELSCSEVNENEGTMFVDLFIDNPRDIDTPVEISIDANSTATNGEDFDLPTPLTIVFPASTDMAQTFSFPIINDAMVNEGDETIVFNLNAVTNDVILGTTTNTLTISDNSIELTNALRITGVFDGPLTGGVPKGIEVFASQDIADLSIFGLGSANNGGGSDDQEFTFPAISVTAGSFIYISNDSMGFTSYFGFTPELLFIEGAATNINGDDAVELFESNLVADVFGDINEDGTDTDWEYLDSWAYRKAATGPDGNTFVLENWLFGGVDALEGTATNADATNPFPIGTYMLELGDDIIANDDNVSTDFNTVVTINILDNDVVPNEVISLEIIQNGTNGNANVHLDFANITYIPNADECGEDMITYEICDANGCDQAIVLISVACPVPMATIAEVTGVDADGVATSLDQTIELQGIVHGEDFRGDSGLQFSLIDATGGIALFSFGIDYYEAIEGDEIIVQGTIDQFNGLTQIQPDTIILVSSGNDLNVPMIVTELNEGTESELIKIENLSIVDPTEWTNDGPGFNVNVTNGINTYTMRIDNDSNIFGTDAPDFIFNLTGIGGQFDNSAPFDEGYQILPRYLDDIAMITSVDYPFVEGGMTVFPNPFSEILTIKTDLDWDRMEVTNLLGQVVYTKNNKANAELNLKSLSTGVYYLTIVNDSERWTTKIVKR